MIPSLYAVIPAGGSGTRLWPLSRSGKPKFLLPLPGPRTMIQETVARLRPVWGAERLLVVTGAAHAPEVRRQLPELTDDQMIVEPLARGSGPAIGLATAIAGRRDPDAIVGSFAADHVVLQQDLFDAAVRAAIDAAGHGHLVTIGIQPSYPETGYGYIRRGRLLTGGTGAACQVDEFKEKPDAATAERYVAAGDYLWNASMFVWRAETLMAEMRRYLPELAEVLEALAAVWDTPARERVFAELWSEVADVSIDEGILERSDRVAVVPASFGWTDLGDWHGLGSILGGGTTENVVVNTEALVRDSRGSVVMGNGRLIALLGLDDVVIVDTSDALLVCHRGRTQEVRKLVDELKHRGARHLV